MVWTLTKANKDTFTAEWDGTKYVFDKPEEVAGKQTNGIIGVRVEVTSQDGTVTNVYTLNTVVTEVETQIANFAGGSGLVANNMGWQVGWVMSMGSNPNANQLPAVRKAIEDGIALIRSAETEAQAQEYGAKAWSDTKDALKDSLKLILAEMLSPKTGVDLDWVIAHPAEVAADGGAYFNNWNYPISELYKGFYNGGTFTVKVAGSDESKTYGPLADDTMDLLQSRWNDFRNTIQAELDK